MTKEEATTPQSDEGATENQKLMHGMEGTLKSGNRVGVYVLSDGGAYMRFIRAEDGHETRIALSRQAMDAVVEIWTLMTMRDFK